MGKRQQRTIGAVVRIDLGNGYYCFARILEHSTFAFYDYLSKEKETEISLIISKPILFILAVYNDIITHGRWEKIGKYELEKELLTLPLEFIQDPINLSKFSLYNPNTGEMIDAKKEDCYGLECAAVWDAEHVEDRIRDHYAGKPNIWLEQLKIKDV